MARAPEEALSITLSLSGAGLQTPAQPLQYTAEGSWQAVFDIPETAIGLPLFAELRLLSGGEPALVRLGEAPNLPAQLQVTVGPAYVDAKTVSAVLQLTVHNPTEGAVYLKEEDIEILHQGSPEGGDANVLSRQVMPSLPLLLAPGETVGLTVTFLPLPVAKPAGHIRASAHRVRPVAGLWPAHRSVTHVSNTMSISMTANWRRNPCQL